MPVSEIPVRSVNITPIPASLLSIDWNDLLWAAITVGRPNRYYVFRHGIPSLYEALFRASLMRMALEESAGSRRFMRTAACKHLDPSEKGAVNYFLGLTLCKAFAEKVLQTPWMLHLDVFRNGLNPVLQRTERSRPDLVGQRLDGQWIAFESKGRVSEPDSKTKLKAKNQSRRVVSVLGVAVAGHYAGISFFKKDTLSFYVEDPESFSPDDPRSISVKGEAAELYRHYYQPLKDAFFGENQRTVSQGELVWRRVDEIDADIGIHARLLELVRQERWAEVGVFCRESHSLLTRSELRADGISVKAGESWRRRIRRQGSPSTTDE